MKLARLLCLSAIIFAFSNFLFAQTAPDLENGFKNYGSYHGSDIDTVDLKSGNLMVHIPMPWSYPQRGGAIGPRNLLTVSSKTWNVKCVNPDNTGNHCFWMTGGIWRDLQVATAGSGLGFDHTSDLSVHRTWGYQTDTSLNVFYFSTGYSVTTPDGGKHAMAASPSAALDPNGNPMAYDATDASGFHIVLSNPNAIDGTPDTAVAIDRHGNRYSGGWVTEPNCRAVFDNQFGGNSSSKSCQQATRLSGITDANGNVFTPTNDTMGRPFSTFAFGGASDSTGCVLSGLTFSSSNIETYPGPNGATNQVKLCYATVNVATAFGVSGIDEAQSTIARNNGSAATATLLVTVILPDGSKWVFNYDSYINLTYIGLPTGGSISYSWQTLNLGFPCNKISRVVASRTLNDNNGHSYPWNYFWGQPQPGSLALISNRVTDPLGNDTVHVFTDPAGRGTCLQYETQTQQFQGASASGQLLKQVDTTYLASNVGYVVPTNIQTTLLPSNKVSLVTKSYDSGLGTGFPIFGNVVSEKEYDWGQGSPGAPLRETDTTYQWQVDSRYLTARLLDLTASVIVKDGGGNRLAETDYTYDEAPYITSYESTVGALPSGTHIAAPNAVRGLETTVSHWLNTTNSFIASHTNWYDTGEAHQTIDPLGHTSTHSYDPVYAGAYSTQTCTPSTGSTAHCVSGTYDFQTGALSSLTNENATAQASGNTAGDQAHTSNFAYDSMGRLTSAQAPPDPANSGARAQSSLTFSVPNTFPFSVQRTKSVTTALTDSGTNFFDGLGRVTNNQHVLPGGTAKVDTVFDANSHLATMSNPYFSTSDPTYGVTTNLYDALGRVYKTTKQDGSVSSVAYSVPTTIAVNGDCTISTDEAGNQRGACSDALGRLVEVDEPNPGTPINVNNHATLQTDGNFVLYNPASSALWSTGTSGSNATSIYMQDDGNLVLYIFKWQAGVYATPSPGPFPAASCSIGSYLMVNQRLNANQCIASPHGQYLLYMASDGNFYIYDLAHNVGTWGPGTYGHPGAYAMLQSDGNFVVYDANGVGIWSSGTYGTNADRLNMEDDGRIIIYKSAWNSGTSDGQFYGTAIAHPGCDVGNSGLGSTGVLGSGSCLVSPNGRFELLMQGDGKLVIYDRSVTPNTVLWSTGTATSPADPGYAMRTLYSYDALGNLLRVDQKGTAPNDSTQWRTRTFTYDSLSRLLTANNPESGTITYSYDLDGNLLQKTSPAPNQTGSLTQTVSYCYDELHRVTGKGYGAQSCPLAAPVVSYVYDSGTNAKGKLTSLTDQAGTASYTYDILGRLSAETRTLTGANNAAISKNLSYEYNLDGSLYKLHYPSGNVVTYAPGTAGLTLSAIDSGNAINYVTGATYGPDSGLTGFVSGNSGTFAGITNAFTYNKRLQPVSMSANAPGQTVFSIGYDFHLGNGTSGADNGNVFGITNYKDQNRNQTFTYDVLNRLTSAQNAGTNCAATVIGGKSEYWGNSYGYDAWGNLTAKSVTKCGAESLSVTADAHNWIHASGTDYLYDAAGNMTRNVTPTVQTYTYDQENRLTGAAGYAYTYDGDGNRVRKSNSSSTGTLYWYMTPGIVGESDLSGNLTDEYVFFDGERVARKSTNGVFYYFSDHLKTASVITDSVGNIKSESDFYPWGGELQFVNNDSNHYKFTGKERDSETQLDYFGARYYSNGLGRWASADWSPTPIPVPYADFHDPQSLNLYGFVGGNPASKADPDGHAGECHLKGCPSGPLFKMSFKDAVKSLADDIGDAISNFLDEAAHGFNAANSNCSCNPQPAQSSPEEGSENNNNSKSTNQSESGGQDKKVPNPNGSKGAPDHQQTVKEEAKEMGGQPEVRVETPGGEKGSRVIDAAKVENGKVTEARQVIRPNKNGTPPAREVRAARDIQKATGVTPKMVPVRPKTPE